MSLQLARPERGIDFEYEKLISLVLLIGFLALSKNTSYCFSSMFPFLLNSDFADSSAATMSFLDNLQKYSTSTETSQEMKTKEPISLQKLTHTRISMSDEMLNITIAMEIK